MKSWMTVYNWPVLRCPRLAGFEVSPEDKGSQMQTEDQKSDLKAIFDWRTKNWRSLDYVSGWFMKAADYGTKTRAVAAFVATNSICQGRQIDTLWSLILSAGYEIAFAYTSFKWANLASYNAGVTVVIVGVSNEAGRTRLLFSAADEAGTIVKAVDNISPYLVPGPNVIVSQLSRPLSDLDEMNFGSMPNDGGYLLLDMDQTMSAIGCHGVEREFIHPAVGTQEFINGLDVDYDLARRNAWLRSRFDCVETKRRESSRATTSKLGDVPFRFGEVRQAGDEVVMVVSKTSSELREYLPVGLFARGTIVTEAFGLFNAPLWDMALIASRLHLVWIATVCGKLKTDFRYSSTLGWNTFPVPTLTEKNKADLTRCAEDVLLAREHHFPATIAELYDPDKMPADLRAAHERNDEVLERIYIGRRFKNDTERLEKLFDLYTKMTAPAGSAGKRKAEARA
jgi:hypothetical protein